MEALEHLKAQMEMVRESNDSESTKIAKALLIRSLKEKAKARIAETDYDEEKLSEYLAKEITEMGVI